MKPFETANEVCEWISHEKFYGSHCLLAIKDGYLFQLMFDIVEEEIYELAAFKLEIPS